MLTGLAAAGMQVASADELAAAIFGIDEVENAVARRTGLEVPIDRSALRVKMASDPTLRMWLNHLMHPRVWRALLDSSADAVEVPLLLESCLQGAFFEVWVADCDETTQVERLVTRWGNELHARELVASQISRSVRLTFADVIVRTNQPIDAVMQSIAICAKSCRERLRLP